VFQIHAFNEAIDVALEGMLYYERYDEQLMIILTVCTTISWIIFVACIVIRIDAAYQKIKGLELISMQKLLISVVTSALLIKGNILCFFAIHFSSSTYIGYTLSWCKLTNIVISCLSL